MANYSLNKIDPSTRDITYEIHRDFDTAREMFDFLAWASKNENGWFYGAGSHIMRDETVIAHTRDYDEMMDPDLLGSGTASIAELTAIANQNKGN